MKKSIACRTATRSKTRLSQTYRFAILLNQFNLRPWYTNQKLDENVNYSRAIDGTDYLPGFIGLNNIKKTDYVNVVIQVFLLYTGPLQDPRFKRLFPQLSDQQIRFRCSGFQHAYNKEVCRAYAKDLESEKFQKSGILSVIFNLY